MKEFTPILEELQSREALKLRIRKTGLMYKEFAILCKLSMTYLSLFLNGRRPLKFSDEKKLFDTLEMLEKKN